MMVKPVPGLGLASSECADAWTSVLVWNWCPVNGPMVRRVSLFGIGALGMGNQ